MNKIDSPSDELMPALFVGHGSPMNVVEDNDFNRAWKEMGKTLPRPRAILAISAHWETSGAQVTAMPTPRTIHDFYGFPRTLNEMQYPAPGAPELAQRIGASVKMTSVDQDFEWGLDHGAWSVLCRMFPDASIPVVQFSLDATQPPAYHYELAKELCFLRGEGVLILGSGNIVHNLRLAAPLETSYPWAAAFDRSVQECILSGDHRDLIHYQKLGEPAQLSIPTNEHYLPMLYILALQEKGEAVQFFAEGFAYGSISMRSFRIG